MKFTIPNLQIYLPKKANSEKLGLGIDNPCRILFLSLRINKCLMESVNDRHVWNPGVFSYRMIPRCRLNSSFFFFLNVASIAYIWSRSIHSVEIRIYISLPRNFFLFASIVHVSDHRHCIKVYLVEFLRVSDFKSNEYLAEVIVHRTCIAKTPLAHRSRDQVAT